jgi:hypothetical protein
MFATSLPKIIGLIAGCLSSWSPVPQLLKCWREGLTEAIITLQPGCALTRDRS